MTGTCESSVSEVDAVLYRLYRSCNSNGSRYLVEVKHNAEVPDLPARELHHSLHVTDDRQAQACQCWKQTIDQ
jgi:hypothetical protein